MVNGTRAAYRLYEVRRGARFARELELEVEGYVEVSHRSPEPQEEVGERLLHVWMRAHDAGGSRVEIAAATLEVSPRLLAEEMPARSRELEFGEADVYEAFPGRVPELVLIPAQDQVRREAIEIPRAWSLPIKVRLEVGSREEEWWTEDVAGVARAPGGVDNGEH